MEFRHHSGTIDPVKIVRWAQFCGKMVDAARAGVEAAVPVEVAVARLTRRKLLHKSRTIVQLITRPQGVTSGEVMVALGRRSPPSSLAADLRRLGVTFVEAGRRNKQIVYKLRPDSAGAGTFGKLMDQLALQPDERDFWTTRRALLASAAVTDPTADNPLEVTGTAATR